MEKEWNLQSVIKKMFRYSLVVKKGGVKGCKI